MTSCRGMAMRWQAAIIEPMTTPVQKVLLTPWPGIGGDRSTMIRAGLSTQYEKAGQLVGLGSG
jgi:hypothetical protein